MLYSYYETIFSLLGSALYMASTLIILSTLCQHHNDSLSIRLQKHTCTDIKTLKLWILGRLHTLSHDVHQLFFV